jgi:hypothetical protein
MSGYRLGRDLLVEGFWEVVAMGRGLSYVGRVVLGSLVYWVLVYLHGRGLYQPGLQMGALGVEEATTMVSLGHAWAENAEATEVSRLMAEATHMSFFPTAYAASPSAATAFNPWFTDFGHLTF